MHLTAEAVVPQQNRKINSQWQGNWSWTVGQPQLRLSGSFLSLGIMKGFFFNLVFCMKTNSVLLAACRWMRAHLHAWMCLVNIKAWPGQSIFWGCFRLDCISYLDIRCCTHSFVSRIKKAFHSGAACRYFSVRAQPKVPAHTVWNSLIHQWL